LYPPRIELANLTLRNQLKKIFDIQRSQKYMTGSSAYSLGVMINFGGQSWY
jgi:hypothetical protein